MSSEQIEIEASDWLARLDAGEPSAQLREAVAAWRAADPRNEVAYLRIRAGWGRLDRLQALRPAAAAAIDPDLFKLKEPRAQLIALPRRKYLAAAAALLLAISAGAWLVFNSNEAIYTTGVGGFERIQLNEGSIIELNTDTQVRVSLEKTQRRIELLKGEAHFFVAREPTRPFIVTAGDTAVRAVGTAFNVRRHANRAVEVIVTEGKVAVGQSAIVEFLGPGDTNSVSAPIVSAGQAVSVAGGHLQIRDLPPADNERELAWQSGMLLFEGDALSDVVGEFNRYNQRQLIVADAALAPLKVGGYFKATNLDAFVNVLRRDFDIAASEEGARIVLRTAGSAK